MLRWLRAMLLPILLWAALPAAGQPPALDVLSAGAVEPGILAAAQAFRRETGQDVAVRFATAPVLRRRMAEGEPADVLLAPPAVIVEAARLGRVDAGQAQRVGQVGVGVAVRQGAALPAIGDQAALRASLLAADRVVFNRASTGLYLETLLERLGIAAEVKAKAVRFPDGAAVMERVLAGTGVEIGLGAITEIHLYADRGLVFVGPLPDAVQNYTAYEAVPVRDARNAPQAAAFVRFLALPATRALMAARGVE